MQLSSILSSRSDVWKRVKHGPGRSTMRLLRHVMVMRFTWQPRGLRRRKRMETAPLTEAERPEMEVCLG